MDEGESHVREGGATHCMYKMEGMDGWMDEEKV